MSTNPLFSHDPASATQPASHTPAQTVAATGQSGDPAVELIRQKIAQVYAEEPPASQEVAQDQARPASAILSRHQQYMHELRTSGKSLADIQTAWHHYYSQLPEEDKKAVWQEFYQQSQAERTAASSPATDAPAAAAVSHPAHQAPRQSLSEDYVEPQPSLIRNGLRDAPRPKVKLQPKHHLQSLIFGLGCGGLALLVVLFSFFNEMFIAPFIQPSRTVNATPIIIGPDGVAPSDKAEVIIPKINVQIPLDFSASSIREDDIQKALEKGVVHYPTTVMPGQQGNAAFFGHSSNNIFNPGQYKFAFVLLHELVPGDTFYLTRDGVAYAYQVIDKKVVEPTEVGILDPIPGKTATATLITCDPPGTTLRRLAVIGEQVSPNPSTAQAGAIPPTNGQGQQTGAAELPGPAPSLWHRLTGWITD